MAVPSSRDARWFYGCAAERYEDAEILLRAGRTTGAVYMAGYGMAIRIPRGRSDAVIESIERALQSYQQDHPSAEIDIYRQSSVSVRVRVIDPDFAGMS